MSDTNNLKASNGSVIKSNLSTINERLEEIRERQNESGKKSYIHIQRQVVRLIHSKIKAAFMAAVFFGLSNMLKSRSLTDTC